jgi:starvation-inducible DNA-binding protein
MSIDIGIPESERQAIAEGLSRLLADSYTLYLKTHNYHWNVTGPMFNTLHLMFPEDDDVPSAEQMLQNLVDAQETVVRTARSVFPRVDEANDEPSADLLTQRMQIHEKNAWMLRSMLEN